MGDICEIRIYDRDFNWLNVTEQAESVQFERELYGIGKFQIKIHPGKRGASDLTRKNNIIVINGDMHRAGIIRDFLTVKNRTEDYYTIYGETGSGLTGQRIAVPPTKEQNPGALGWDRILDNAETVIKHYLNANLTAPYDPKRKIGNLVMTPDLKRGIKVASQLRYTKLSDDLYNIASYAEMGYEIYADTLEKKWIFDVIEGADRTTEQEALSPVTFNLENQNIDNYRYVEDSQNYKNTGYAGGKGEDENRLIQIIGAENTGLDRHETFLDCGSVELTDLLYYGSLRLSEFKEAKTVEAEVLPKVFIFNKDYFLGDRCTVFISQLGLQLHTRITSVKETWERQSGYKTEIRLGGKVPNIFTILGKTEGVR